MRAFLIVIVLLALATVTMGFVSTGSRAQPLVAPPADASTEALLPPTTPLPDGGLVPDAGQPMTP